jgi:hypothetical protein
MAANEFPSPAENLMGVGEVKCNGEVFCDHPVKCSKLVVFGSSIIVNRVMVSSNYLVETAGDDYIVMVDTANNIVNISLPQVGGPLTQGRIIHIIDVGGNAIVNNIVISADGGGTISNQPTIVIDQNYNSVSMVSSDSAWFIF